MFQGKPENYQLNIKTAEGFRARPAVLTSPTGEQEPAVVLHSPGRVHGVLPIADALRISNEIADAVEASERATP